MLQTIMPIIENRYSGEITVDWYFHVWYNESSLCEVRSLEELKQVATAITTEPVECMWSWGKGWQNQWHGVDLAFQTLERFGKLDDYTLILKSRVDLMYTDFDFEEIWQKRGPPASSRRGVRDAKVDAGGTKSRLLRRALGTAWRRRRSRPRVTLRCIPSPRGGTHTP